MRRTLLAVFTAATLAIGVVTASPALAVGPGGWSHVGVGGTASQPSLNGTVTALNADNPGVLYAGGTFTSAGGNSRAKRIARWNGSTWSSLGNTPITNGGVFAIAYHAGKVYVGGTFQNAGGNANADFLAVYDGTSWAPFCTPTTPGPAFTANVNALKIVGNTLYVGGSFDDGAGLAAADYLVGCDLTTGAASATVANDGDINGAVYALTVDSNGTLYAGGQFINLGGIPEADHVAAFDGSWHAMGGDAGAAAVDSYVRSLATIGTDVYVGTDAVNVASIAQADHVARWDGSSWSAVGADHAGTDGWFSTATAYTIDGLSHYGSVLIATGSFQNADGIATADDIAYFDGSTWRPLGSDGQGDGPWSGHGVAVAVSGGQVYAAGNFTSAGGDSLARSVASHALRLPDAAIGGSSTGHFTGNSVYSPSGSGETRKVKIQRGHSDSAYIRIQNDGIVPGSFRLTGTGGGHGISPSYFFGGTEITSSVRAGTFTTASIEPRDSILIRIHVAVAHSSATGATFTTKAEPSSGTPTDAVRLVVDATN